MNARQSLYSALHQTAVRVPGNNALSFLGRFVTYQKLLSRIDEASAGFVDLGIKKSDVVTLCMPNIFACVYAFYALNKIGAVCHMVHPLTPVKQMQGFLESTNSHILFIVDSFYDTYAPLLSDSKLTLILCNPVDEFGIVKRLGYQILNRKRLANIHYENRVISFRSLLMKEKFVAEDSLDSEAGVVYLHSGGTSGKPKTIVLSSFAINSLAMKADFILNETDFTGKAMLAVLPMFHGFGLCMGIHGMLCFGGCDALMPKFNALETNDLLKKNRVNFLIGVPSLFENLLSKPEFAGPHLQNLRQAFVGGDFVSPSLKIRFDDLMKNWGSQARLLEGYGLTEVVTVCTVNRLVDYRPDSVGRPLPGLAIKIVDLEKRTLLPLGVPGEIAVAGDTRMIGYLHDPEATAATFLTDENKTTWVLTGDFGFLNPDGHLHFKQRLKRIVKVSGIPIMPSEIETLVTSFEGVAEAAAIGVDDADRGHMIKLFIRMKKDAPSSLDEATLHQRIKEELSVYAVPKTIQYLDEMPHTIVGKVDILTLEAREKK